MANLALSYQQAGKSEDAMQPAVHVLENGPRILGEKHPSILNWMANFAAALTDMGDFDKSRGAGKASAGREENGFRREPS